MTNEIKNVPELRFPGFEGEWRLINLKNCFHTIKNGFVGTATPFYTDNSGVRYLQSNNVKNGFLNDNVKIYVTKEFNEKYKSNQLKSGDMLMVQSGHAGATAVVSDAYEGSNCHALIIMKPKSNINTVFLNNYFQSGKGVKSIYSLITGNTIKHILSSDVKKITFSTPVIGEQEKIGDFFSKLDRQIELEEQKLEKLEEQKKGYMQQIFSQKLRFKNENRDDYLQWNITTIEKIAKVSKGFTPSTKDINLWQNDNKNWLSIAGMSDKYIYEGNKGISIAGEGKHKKVNEDTLIMSFKLTLGKVAIVKTPIYTNEAICHFEWKTNQIKTDYMYYYLSFTNIKSFGAQAVKGITLNNDSINSIVIKLPEFLEQNKIGNFFNKCDELIEKQNQKIDGLKKRKQGFLQKMFV